MPLLDSKNNAKPTTVNKFNQTDHNIVSCVLNELVNILVTKGNFNREKTAILVENRVAVCLRTNFVNVVRDVASEVFNISRSSDSEGESAAKIEVMQALQDWEDAGSIESSQ